MQNLPSLAVFFIVVFAIAAFGAQFTPGDWYATLKKPGFTPPNAVFAPVWTTLYVLIAVSGWLVWRRAGTAAGLALTLYGVQLVLNAAWSWLFFGEHRVGLALIDIALLLTAILATIAVFRRHDSLAAALLVPYALWVGYATALNAAIWHLNR